MCAVLSAWRRSLYLSFFFFNDTATTEIYTLSLHDALPISPPPVPGAPPAPGMVPGVGFPAAPARKHTTLKVLLSVGGILRSEEHTSELQSQSNLVCRLLLEKKKKNTTITSAQPIQHYAYNS